jgi:hypothetical protein
MWFEDHVPGEGKNEREASKIEHIGRKEVKKGVWGMPRLSKAKKDVISCEKLWGAANRL